MTRRPQNRAQDPKTRTPPLPDDSDRLPDPRARSPIFVALQPPPSPKAQDQPLPTESNLHRGPWTSSRTVTGEIEPKCEPEGPHAAPHPRLQRATPRTSRPSEPGETASTRSQDGLVDNSRSLEDRAAPSLDSAPTPLTFDALGKPATFGLRSLKVRGKRPLSEEICLLLWGFLPPQRPRDCETVAGPGLWIR